MKCVRHGTEGQRRKHFDGYLEIQRQSPRYQGTRRAVCSLNNCYLNCLNLLELLELLEPELLQVREGENSNLEFPFVLVNRGKNAQGEGQGVPELGLDSTFKTRTLLLAVRTPAFS